VLDLGVLAVRDLGQEYGVLALSVEVFLLIFVDLLVLAGSGVFLAGQGVLSQLVGLEELASHLARHEVGLVVPMLGLVLLGVVESGAHGVVAEAGIGGLGHLLGGDGGSARLGLHNEVAMLVAIVGLPRSLKDTDVVPLDALVVGTGTRVVDRRRVLKDR